jgi:hypothetical protein
MRTPALKYEGGVTHFDGIQLFFAAIPLMCEPDDRCGTFANSQFLAYTILLRQAGSTPRIGSTISIVRIGFLAAAHGPPGCFARELGPA